MQICISEAINWKKTLETRHQELVALRNENATRSTRLYGANVDKTQIIEPLYNAKALDSLITGLAREIRTLDNAIKKTNAITMVIGYDQNDAVLGELQMEEKKDEKQLELSFPN
jgi:hypothetical protein